MRIFINFYHKSTSSFPQHFSLFSPLFDPHTYNYNCTIHLLQLHNSHFTTAQIVISCTLKYALHILVSKFTQRSLEFLHRRVYCNSLLMQFVTRIHHPRTEKSILPDPSFMPDAASRFPSMSLSSSTQFSRIAMSSRDLRSRTRVHSKPEG